MEPCLSRSIPHGEHSAVWAGDLSVGGELRAPGLRCQQQSPRSVLGGSGLSYGGGGGLPSAYSPALLCGV